VNKEQKQEAVKEIGAALEESNAVFAVDYRGISVPDAAELRSKLREADASFSVVKNRLAKRITADVGAEALDEHLVGPTALAYVRGDAVLAAKAINDFIKANDALSYKGGIMEGKPLGPDGFTQIARLPGIDQLRGQLVGLAASPLSGLVRTLNAMIGGLATQLGQISEQGLVGKEAPADAAEEPPAEKAEEPAPAEEASQTEESEAEEASEAEEPAAEAPAGEAEQPAAEAEAAAEEEPAAEAEAAAGEDTTSEETEADEQGNQPDADPSSEGAAAEEPKED
jgi:large subunit ribosomal protein L10